MATSDTMTLSVLTPEKTLLDAGVSKVTLPGTKGPFMVLRNHAPLISSLEEGDIVYVSGDQPGRIHIISGFADNEVRASW